MLYRIYCDYLEYNLSVGKTTDYIHIILNHVLPFYYCQKEKKLLKCSELIPFSFCSNLNLSQNNIFLVLVLYSHSYNKTVFYIQPEVFSFACRSSTHNIIPLQHIQF